MALLIIPLFYNTIDLQTAEGIFDAGNSPSALYPRSKCHSKWNARPRRPSKGKLLGQDGLTQNQASLESNDICHCCTSTIEIRTTRSWPTEVFVAAVMLAQFEWKPGKPLDNHLSVLPPVSPLLGRLDGHHGIPYIYQ